MHSEDRSSRCSEVLRTYDSEGFAKGMFGVQGQEPETVRESYKVLEVAV